MMHSSTSSPHPRRRGAPLTRLALIVSLTLLNFVRADAATAAEPAIRSFNLPAGTAAKTLRQFTEQSGIPVAFGTDTALQVRTNEVKGEFTPAEAIAQLLARTGLVASANEKTGAITVSRDPKAPRAALAPAHDDRPDRPAPALAPAAPQPADDVLTMNPFTVEDSRDVGYMATHSLAGTRLRTDLRDLASSVTVLTKELIEDLGATDSQTLLSYATNFEVTGANGNYLGAGSSASFGSADETGQFFSPGTSTRVRGLISADNTRNFFRTNVRWDSYNVDRVDLQRGPNSVLFGLGSPGGVINASVDAANLGRNATRVDLAFDQFGSVRGSFNLNQVVRRNELAVAVAALRDEKKFRQDPAYDYERRHFLAAKYRPRFLNSPESSFEVTADWEHGRSNSNRPRFATPLDQVTMFVTPTVIRDIQLPAGSNFQNYSHGVIPGATYFLNSRTIGGSLNLQGAIPNEFVKSFDGNGVRQVFSSQGSYWSLGRTSAYGAMQTNGTQFTGTPTTARRIWGVGYLDVIPTPVNAYATAIRHPFAAYFSPVALSDPSVYDFYNLLLDGSNKREWNEFDQLRASLSHTFRRNTLGYEVSYFRETSKPGQLSMMSDNSRIFVDVNEVLIDGRRNPDVGRAFIQEATYNGNRVEHVRNEAFRVSAFVQHDFRKNSGSKRLSWFLGRHVLNAAWSQDSARSDSRRFEHYVYGDELLGMMGWINPTRRFQNNNRVTARYYLSGDLRGRSGIAGASLGNISANVMPAGGPIPLRYFNTRWTAPASVRPAAAWITPDGSVWDEAANPANYAGWQTAPFGIIDALSGRQADFDLATRNAVLQKSEITSKVATWQGFLLNGSLVTTLGLRQDSNVVRRLTAGVRDDQGADVRPSAYQLGLGTRQEVSADSRSVSLVGHLGRLPVLRRLPFEVSLTYNRGENFNPTAGRLNLMGEPLPAPQGDTREIGVVVATRDNRFSLRIQKFETSVLNASIEGVPQGFTFSQFFGNGAVSGYNARTGLLREQVANNGNLSWSIDDQERIHAPAWLKFEQDFQARFPLFVERWKRFGTWAPGNVDTTFQSPGGTTTTADTLARGYELELVAHPTRQLRLTLNASKLESVVDNAPGDSYRAIYSFIQNSLFDGTQPTNAGKLRNQGNPVNTTIADWWLANVWTNYATVLERNGQIRDEVVKWRANAVANYTFAHPRLKGVSVGGAYRWEGGAAIGYPRMFDAFGFVRSDLTHPFRRASTDRIDLNLRYRRKLFDRYDWSIQLNVYNALGQNELLPVRVNPDGTTAQFRIQEGPGSRVTNTVRF